jgi:putative oxidoreductase
MNALMERLSRWNGCAMLAVRLLLGSILIRAGYAKFFEAGIGKIVENFRGYGIPLAEISAPFIATLELVGGVLLVLGFFTRYLGLLYTVEFIVAAWVKYAMVPPPAGGYIGSRLDTLIVVVAFLLATQGAGKLSFDAKYRGE